MALLGSDGPGVPRKPLGEQRKLARACCFCGESAFTKLLDAQSADAADEQFELVECQNCHIVRTEPSLGDDTLEQYYGSSYYGSTERKFSLLVEVLTRWANYYRAKSLLATARAGHSCSRSRPLRVLDIGCGRGSLLKALHRLGCECYGVERENFRMADGSKDIRLYCQQLETIHLGSSFFDVAIMWHSLEHMSNPSATLGEVARILTPGGLLVVAVPNFDSSQRRLFGAHWFHLDVARHTHHFGVQPLLNSLRAKGFRILSTTTFCFEQNPYAFVQSCLNALTPRTMADALYSSLKVQQNAVLRPSLLGWLGLAFLISPLALAEYLVSGILGVGATIGIRAERL